MFIMKNLNVILVVILYGVFLLGVILAMQFHPNGITSDLIFYSFFAVHFIMLFLIFTSIIMATIYLMMERSIKNVIVLLVSGLSVSWMLVVLYVAGTIMSNF